MKIGVPTEIKDQEFRVGLTPAAIASLVNKSHQVKVQKGAGIGSGFSDADYLAAGAALVIDAEEIYAQDMVVKVKEPLPSEYDLIHPNLILFTYLHLAADRTLTEALLKSQVCGIAYETVQTPNGQLPLLTPMSIIAGRLAVQFGAHFLTRQQGGRGVLLGGIPGVRSGRVVIIGGGIVGTEAARIAVGMGARVQILDVNIDRLGELEQIFGSRVELLMSNPSNISETVRDADLVIGAVLIAGRKAPTLVSKSLVSEMRSHSVIVDVAVDQGGCIETMHTTSHTNPVFEAEGVLHYGVPNIPGAVPWTSTQALVNVTFPYVMAIANHGLAALDLDPVLAQGLNVNKGKIIHPAIAATFPDLT